jgi:acetyl-CoA carboxylase biotin carboxyl carrier protein
MEFKDIKELILLVNATEITDFEMEAGDLRICIRKGQGDTAPIQVSPQDPALAFSDVGPASKGSLGLEAVVAPMVGTFYRAPAQDAPPFVEEGDVVAPGQVLFIIEAMKMMNEIEAEFGGVVEKILVANGEPVEYGQPLCWFGDKGRVGRAQDFGCQQGRNRAADHPRLSGTEY